MANAASNIEIIRFPPIDHVAANATHRPAGQSANATTNATNAPTPTPGGGYLYPPAGWLIDFEGGRKTVRPTRGSVLSVTPDPRWTHAVIRWEPFQNGRREGAEPEEWTWLFIGWAAVVRWVGSDEQAGEYESVVEPVFLDDEGTVTTLSGLGEDIDHAKGMHRLVRLQGSEP